MRRSIPRSLVALGFLSLALGACAPTVATRGNLVDPDQIGEIKPGVSSRDDVANLLGSPSSTSTFDQDTWYYIGQRTEKTAFFQPEVVERRVYVVHFDAAGVVDRVDQLDGSAGRAVELVDRQTPTAGRDMTFIEQMLANVGRFPTGGGKGGMSAGGPSSPSR